MNQEQKARFSDALARVSGDAEILATLASIASEDAPELLDRLDESIEGRDWSSYANTAHSLKGLLSTFETREPVSEIQPLIDAARRAEGDAVVARHETLRTKLQTLIVEIESLNG
jgi:HPt (histidine-containing phosphotransfer) domain-containing protein